MSVLRFLTTRYEVALLSIMINGDLSKVVSPTPSCFLISSTVLCSNVKTHIHSMGLVNHFYASSELSIKALNGSSQLWITKTSVFRPSRFFVKDYNCFVLWHTGMMIVSLMSRIVFGIKVLFKIFDGFVFNKFLENEFVHRWNSQIECIR